MESETTSTFDTYAFLELMGHQCIAGRVTEERIADKALLRVDVPDRTDEPGTGFTRFYSPNALYAVSPASEEDVLRWVEYNRPKKAPVWLPQIPEVARLTAGDVGEDEGEFEL